MPVSLKRTHSYLLAITLALAACGGGGGGGSTPTQPTQPGNPADRGFSDPLAYSSSGNASLSVANEGAALTHHSLNLGGRVIDYTATAGHLIASHPQTSQPKAAFFYVAYTAKNQDARTRPVTFFYNGGPGSASVWLHLGSYGPKRLQVGYPATSQPQPFPLVDNQESLLDTSDLVFVDAIGAGLSQAIAPHTNQTFWGVDADAEAFRDFVNRYLAVNQRTASPKFILGESYGGVRSSVLADLLEAAGTRMNGVILLSPILNYYSNCAVYSPGEANCTGFLPTYANTGAHFRLTNPAQTDYVAYAQQMRSYAASTYGPAVASWLGSRLPPSTSLVDQLVGLTGARANLWQANLSLHPNTYQFQLITGTVLGRYDARVTAPQGSALASEGDPSSTFITSSFASTIRSYLASQLKYTAQSSYAISSNAIQSWNWQHDGQDLPDTLPDLAAALQQNPNLKIMVLHGYNDLATPFHQTELDLARLGNVPGLRIHNYEGGHMMYLDDASRVKTKADLAAFYASALN
ncbi:S10 family peptidase [Chitinimonas sp. JJ19]|uniref:S10 family peptidase n=1 Tax=Chitinimonas sp. JJ19 TaxID=3109352 RepID=UPI002FFE7094